MVTSLVILFRNLFLRCGGQKLKLRCWWCWHHLTSRGCLDFWSLLAIVGIRRLVDIPLHSLVLSLCYPLWLRCPLLFSNDLSLGFGTVLEELSSEWITISGPTNKDRKHFSGDHSQHTAPKGLHVVETYKPKAPLYFRYHKGFGE